ncbi:MAG: 50S ribosomal protein L5 [Candidatus Pacearchaeota archaeon]|nr:MAG: 50S ribosomal protein L5 [Candidatus Pacearchaeota archaeon]
MNEDKMREIKIDSITLHCSTSDPGKLDKSIKLLKLIAKATPVKTLAKKRIPAFKIRPGLPIGCKVTVRKNTNELLKMLFTGIPSLKDKQFNPGFLSFGVKEYIEITSIPYQRDIGIIGFDVVVKLKRPGFRITQRKRTKSKIGKKHRITKVETKEFFEKNFEINIEK